MNSSTVSTPTPSSLLPSDSTSPNKIYFHTSPDNNNNNDNNIEISKNNQNNNNNNNLQISPASNSTTPSSSLLSHRTYPSFHTDSSTSPLSPLTIESISTFNNNNNNTILPPNSLDSIQLQINDNTNIENIEPDEILIFEDSSLINEIDNNNNNNHHDNNNDNNNDESLKRISESLVGSNNSSHESEYSLSRLPLKNTKLVGLMELNSTSNNNNIISTPPTTTTHHSTIIQQNIYNNNNNNNNNINNTNSISPHCISISAHMFPLIPSSSPTIPNIQNPNNNCIQNIKHFHTSSSSISDPSNNILNNNNNSIKISPTSNSLSAEPNIQSQITASNNNNNNNSTNPPDCSNTDNSSFIFNDDENDLEDSDDSMKSCTTNSKSSSSISRCIQCSSRNICNFGGIFIFLTLFQVIVACALVWYIGYSNTLDTVGILTHDIRSSILSSTINKFDDRLSMPIRAAHLLNRMTELRFPNFMDRTTLMDVPGALADITLIASIYPNHFFKIGIMNRYGLFVTATRDLYTQNFNAEHNMNVALYEPAITVGPDPVTYTSLHSLRHERDEFPLQVRPDIRNDETSENMKEFLGQSTYELRDYRPLERPFWLAGEDILRVNATAGWSNPYLTSSFANTSSYFSAAAIVPKALPSGELGSIAMVVMHLQGFIDLLSAVPYGSNGFSMLVRGNGSITAASASAKWINEFLAVHEIDYNIFYDSDPGDDFIQTLKGLLIEWNLITNARGINPRNASLYIPYRSTAYSKSIIYRGDQWEIQAQMLTNSSSGLTFTVVIVTKDDDFNGNLLVGIRNTGLLSLAVLVVSICLSALVTRCVTRPLNKIVTFMERAVRVVGMDRGTIQKKELSELCNDWSKSSGMIMPPNSSNLVGNPYATKSALTIQEEYFHEVTPLYSSFCWLCNPEGETCCCFRVGRSLREVQLMHRAFGSMLYSLASYDELEAINQAKRQFIRYIFHEVRVPFNAIVLGIEQLHTEIQAVSEVHTLLPTALDTIEILSEQSQVVSRILNDVLSMQKIEDGALELEYDVFSIDRMIRSSLYSFRSPCAEKQLKVRINLQNLDEFIDKYLPGLKLGKLTNKEKDEKIQEKGKNSHSSQDSASSKQYVNHAFVRGDPYRLRQVLANFVSNAIKFSPNRSVIRVVLDILKFDVNPMAVTASEAFQLNSNQQILNEFYRYSTNKGVEKPTLSTSSAILPISPPGIQSSDNSIPVYESNILGTAMIRVSVQDQGPGVSPEHQQNLFQAYMQVNAGKTQKGNGTGLGLNISKSIIELHGGTIGYMKDAKGGSEFFFLMPVDISLVKTRGTSGSSNLASSSLVSDSMSSHHLTNRSNLINQHHISNGSIHLSQIELQQTKMPSNTNSNGLTKSNTDSDLKQSLPLNSAYSPDSPIGSPMYSNNLLSPMELLPDNVSITNNNNNNTSESPPPPIDKSGLPPAHSKIKSSTGSSTSTKPFCRVLVVEDSAPNRKLLMSLLTRLNCSVYGVENGQLCVDLFQPYINPLESSPIGAGNTRTIKQQADLVEKQRKSYPFDVILMDGSMPVLNGVEATQKLRQNGIKVPIVAVTGNALSEDVKAFKQAGANDVLTKPINRAELQRVLNTVLCAKTLQLSSSSSSSVIPPANFLGGNNHKTEDLIIQIGPADNDTTNSGEIRV